MDRSKVMTPERCERDHALWIEEIAAWKRDHAQALHTLEDATAFILKHEAQLDDHMREIEEHQAARPDKPEQIEQYRANHVRVDRDHNLFRGRHRGLIQEVMKLRVALHKAGHGEVF